MRLIFKNSKIFLDFIKKNYTLLILIIIISLFLYEPVKKSHYEKFETENKFENPGHTVLINNPMRRLIRSVTFYPYSIKELCSERFEVNYYEDKFKNSSYRKLEENYKKYLIKFACECENINFTQTNNYTLEINNLFDDVSTDEIPEQAIVINDSDLYAYRSYLYIQGIIHPLTATPIIKHGNIPSLFTGLSILIFKTRHVAPIFIGIVFLFSLFFVSYSLFRNKMLSLIIAVVFYFNSLFKGQLLDLHSGIDLYQSLFTLLSFYFLFKIIDYGDKSRYYFLLSLSLGGAISIKPVIGVLLIITILSYFFCINSLKNLKRVLKYLPFSLLVYLTVEWPKFVLLKRFFLFYNFIPIKLITSIFFFQPFTGPIFTETSMHVLPFDLFKMLFTRMTFLSLTSFLSIYFILKKRDQKKEIKLFLLYLWTLSYCIFVSFKINGSPFYLVEVLPAVYILSCYACLNFYKNIKRVYKKIPIKFSK